MGIYLYSSLFALVIATSILSVTEGHGTVFLRLMRYENWEGKGANGHCCDGKWSICQSNGCDHSFKVCLDRRGGFGCLYGRIQSGSINNQNVIDFGDTIANLSNPIPFPFKGTAPSTLDVKVAVYDADNSYTNGQNDFVEFLKGAVPLSPDPEEHVLKGRTKLKFELWYRCSKGITERCGNPRGQKRGDFYHMMDGLDELEY